MPRLEETKGYDIIYNWLASKGRSPFLFQQQTWKHIINGESGLVNAPTGCGKTFSVFLGAIIDFINHHPDDFEKIKNNGLQLLWITPLRALAKDIGRTMEEAIHELDIKWKVGIRNGDTSTTERARQKNQMPEVLIITPESLHLLLAQKGYADFFSSLKIIAVDEWHELLESKRGVQVELAVGRILNVQYSMFNTQCSIWGISATIGNLVEAKEVLLASLTPQPPLHKVARAVEPKARRGEVVHADMQKQIAVESIFPDEIEKYPWAGHLGIKLINKIIPIIHQSKTTLIFINTRGMSEIWYQQLLNAAPDLAGAIALHHGSIEQELRTWVEDALHSEKMKAVVCTSSLDLGVDFRPVETVIQVGSPKGVARFLQRAGRSGHSHDAVSKIYFLPTHSLELIEAAALKTAIKEQLIESRVPLQLCFDVLIQYLCTLAISDGFVADEIFKEIKSTYCYKEITKEEWQKVLHHITSGGHALQQYDDYKKVELIDGVFRMTGKKIAMRHRLHIGTIVSESMMRVQLLNGGFIGIIEEWFISRLQPGDVFSLAGRKLEFVSSKDMTAMVRKSTAKKSIVPSWQGGRMPLSANLGRKLRETLDTVSEKTNTPSPPERGQGVRSTQSSKNEKKMKKQPGYYTTDPETWKQNLPLAKEMRQQPAETEKILWEQLRNRKLNGYKFRRQHPVENYIADFICIEAKLIIELDGHYHNEPPQKNHDEERTFVLSLKKFKIIRFYNSEIEKNIDGVINTIRKYLITADNSDHPLTPSNGGVTEELQALQPLFELQQQLSHVPKENELLIEQIETKDGFHLFVYPFEGRLVHEAMAAILAYRISRITPITFSFAMNDYGFELLSDQPIPVDDSNVYELFSPENLFEDIQRSVNSTEMAKRKFRDIATIGGLIFQGMPGERKKARHLQATASLLFNVFSEYEPGNLLLRQSFQEVYDLQMEEVRLRDMLNRIQQSKIIITFPQQLTPFCFPVKVDSMREDLSSEQLEQRVKRMQMELEPPSL